MALTNADASLVLGMLARGDNNHDIAAWFGENPARVAEVKAGSHGVTAAPRDQLPPQGAVGRKARRLRGRVNTVIKLLEEKGADGAAEALSTLQGAIADFNKNER